MLNRLRVAAAALLCAASFPTLSYTANCGEHFPEGGAPAVQESVQLKIRILCYERFAVVHSGVTMGPLIVSEHLRADHVKSAKVQIRVNLFHPEARLNPPERAELSDFARSGYDRGHMAPSGDIDRKSVV